MLSRGGFCDIDYIGIYAIARNAAFVADLAAAFRIEDGFVKCDFSFFLNLFNPYSIHEAADDLALDGSLFIDEFACIRERE